LCAHQLPGLLSVVPAATGSGVTRRLFLALWAVLLVLTLWLMHTAATGDDRNDETEETTG
jgi:hypothetical protein